METEYKGLKYFLTFSFSGSLGGGDTDGQSGRQIFYSTLLAIISHLCINRKKAERTNLIRLLLI